MEDDLVSIFAMLSILQATLHEKARLPSLRRRLGSGGMGGGLWAFSYIVVHARGLREKADGSLMVFPAGNRPSPQAHFGSSFYRRPDNPNRGKARDAKGRDWPECRDLWAITWSVHVEKRRCDKRDTFFIGLIMYVIGHQLGNFRPDSGGRDTQNFGLFSRFDVEGGDSGGGPAATPRPT